MALLSLKRIGLVAQLLIFIGLLLYLCLPFTWNVNLPVEFWIKQGSSYLFWIFVFYVNYTQLLPKFLFKGKAMLFVIGIIGIIISVVAMNVYLDRMLNLYELVSKAFKIDPSAIHHEARLLSYFSSVIITLLLIGSGTVISVAQRMQAENELRENLEHEKISSELSFLKSQINPHFFFNILNSIYALTPIESTPARDAIYTLSHMMRYVLYDTKNKLTPLTKEIAFIENYLQLMQLRLNDQVQVIFDKPTEVQEKYVAPMLLLPFVENAFKHGISSVQPSFVFIELSQKNDLLKIEVRNSLHEDVADVLKEDSNGIGLANTQRRLDLLYPGKYWLTAEALTQEKEFQVKLTIDLS